MRQILTISCGQSGNSIAIDYWKQLSQEAKINYLGLGEAADPKLHYLPYYFQEKNESYIPNTVFIDTDPTILDELQQSEMHRFFSQDSYVNELIPSQGVYQNPIDLGENNNLIQSIEQAIRKQAEENSNIQGIQVLMSSAGGTGSGVGSYLSDYLKDQFPKKEAFYHILIPTLLNCQSPLELYNTIIFLPQIGWNLSFLYDNQALQSTCFNAFYDQAPDFNSLNSLFSQGVLGTTQHLRYPGMGNNSFAKMVHSMIPFYRLNFLTINQAPLVGKCDDINELCYQLFMEKQQFCTFDPNEGKYLTCQLSLKGDVSLPELDQVIYKTVPENSFVRWLPDSIQKTLCSEFGDLSAVLMNNSTAIGRAFSKLVEELETIFCKKAYLHIYQNMGIEQRIIRDALHEMREVCLLYGEYYTDEKEDDD